MVLFPAFATLIALACIVLVARDVLARPRPDKVAWAVAFALFAIAAGCDVLGEVTGWSAPLARLYYVAGVALVVGYLALGELYLLAPRPTAIVGPGIALLVTALTVAVALDAPVDADRLAAEGWHALRQGPVLTGLATTINVAGTVVLVGGALVSAWRFWRRGVQRHRMIGCIQIAAGALIVAAGGTLSRLGQPAYLYVAMSLGIATIFAGYLETRRPDRARPAVPAIGTEGAAVLSGHGSGANGLVDVAVSPSRNGPAPAASAAAVGETDRADSGIAYLETRVLPLPGEGVAALCDEWGAADYPTDRFDRDGARRIWALRLRLSPAAQDRFDALPVPARLRLAELYHEVFAPGVVEPATGAAAAEGRRTVQSVDS